MDISCKDGHNKGEKWYEPNRSRRYYEEVARIHRKAIQKKIFMTKIITMVRSLIYSQTSWIAKQVGLQKHHYEQSFWR